MHLRIETDRSSWEAGLSVLGIHEFLQSFDWGIFQERVGYTVLRFVVEEHGQIIWQGQGIISPLYAKYRYVYFPRVPSLSQSIWAVVSAYLVQRGIVFARIEPITDTPFVKSIPQVQCIPCRQPAQTLMLSLTIEIEALFAAMHSKTRYNIRLAEKKGVTITKEKRSDIFCQLTHDTANRDAFRAHDDAYYAAMIDMPMVDQWIAWYNGVPLASHLCILYGDVYTYVHGASSSNSREVMAPYLLQWHQIQQALTHGCRFYDFWGISPSTLDTPQMSFHHVSWDAAHAWTGVTRFKAGFGGDRVSYGSAIEVSLRPWVYALYQYAKRIRRMI
jgi:peptidoglycan pentaglycine glycine transferase (the first glycine)